MTWMIGMITSAFFPLFGLYCVCQTIMNGIAESLQDAEYLRGSQRDFRICSTGLQRGLYTTWVLPIIKSSDSQLRSFSLYLLWWRSLAISGDNFGCHKLERDAIGI